MSIISSSVMDVLMAKEISLKEGTSHTIITDQEEVEGWPVEVTWITCMEKTEEQLLDTIEAIVRRDTPQRVSVPGLQMFCGMLDVDKLCKLVDRIMNCFAGTQHQVVIPTVRYVPASFMFWEACFTLNKHIWSRAVEYGYGVLNLHRNFMSRQNRSWVVHGPCYTEFCEETGLGTSLSSEGLKRYEARMLRLHSNGFEVEHPQTVPEEVMPLPLWSTAAYCNSRSCSELLESLGYCMEIPKRKRQAKSARTVQQPVVSGRRAKRGRSESVGQDPAAAARSSRGRGRGCVTPRDVSGNMISTLQLEAGTVRSMIRQISELKMMVKEQEKDLQEARTTRVAMEKDLERARDDVRRKDNVVAVIEARSRAESRSVRREREAQWEESQEWVRQRKEWHKERRDMLDMYEQLHAKHYELKGQFEVFREFAGADRVEKKARKERK